MGKKNNPVIEVLMERDSLSKEEASEIFRMAKSDIYELLESGDGYDEIEDILANELGLEMDYIFYII